MRACAARSLSGEALVKFTEFFLTVCIALILVWAEEETRLGNLPARSGNVLEAVLYRGELLRGDADTVVNTGIRQALVSSQPS